MNEVIIILAQHTDGWTAKNTVCAQLYIPHILTHELYLC